jgi:hypothetical protein
MRLASDDIVIALPPSSITLVPTLRAAFRLERRYDGFEKLLRLVADGNLDALTDVIREGAGESVVTRYLDDLDVIPLHIGVDGLIGPAIEFIFALTGADESQVAQPSADKRIPLREHYTNLFRIATGWLGWTPTDAWNATPAEIMEAFKGHQERLVAIHGGKKQDEETIDLTKGPLDTDARNDLNALGDLNVQEMPVR